MSAPRTPSAPRRVAVIGAGLAGVAAASDLQAGGLDVVVWEKSRGAGGRTATRRGPDGMRFDHGAPFLHDAGAPLRGLPQVAAYEPLLPGGETLATVVGAGSANAPAKALAADLTVRTGVRVGAIRPAGRGRWLLQDERGEELGTFDAVLVTAPAPQAAELLRGASPGLAEQAAGVDFAPCWSVMCAWDAPLDLPFTAAAGRHGLDWAIGESPKPGRAPGERWVLQADAARSAGLLEDAPEAVGAQLLERFGAVAGRALPAPAHVAAHRWLYARPTTPLTQDHLRDGTLLAAGDWCGGDTAGAAVRSGRAAAASLLA